MQISKAAMKLYLGLESVKHSVLVTVFGYHSVCKHRPTCSQYTINQMQKNGTIAGLWQGIIRIFTCF